MAIAAQRDEQQPPTPNPAPPTDINPMWTGIVAEISRNMNKYVGYKFTLESSLMWS
jgi:hypothetical protein